VKIENCIDIFLGTSTHVELYVEKMMNDRNNEIM